MVFLKINVLPFICVYTIIGMIFANINFGYALVLSHQVVRLECASLVGSWLLKEYTSLSFSATAMP
jgi:hypothetical protein